MSPAWDRLPAMLRLLLVLTAALLLALGGPGVTPTALAELAVEVSHDADCCPDGDRAEGDCCDWDFGACCASGNAAALARVRVQAAHHPSALPETRAFLPQHLLRPRHNGPPPTPPPIG